MVDTMSIEDYLAQGGVLTAPDNVPARYRGELMRLMSSFVDSELAASAGFAGVINFAPGLKERIAASRITLEKADHARRVLNIMSDFGTDADRYQAQHDWTARVDRNADLGVARRGDDMRLAVFHYPIENWTDAVVMNVLQGSATGIQMSELTRVSYAPLADVFREIAPRERHHAELGYEGLQRIASIPEGKKAAQEAVTYWRPRVATSFGVVGSSRFDTLKKFGLRHTSNEELLSQWETAIGEKLRVLGLSS
jgi:1,2-phenylacetyl-CoA epoxidase catalytic subunit